MAFNNEPYEKQKKHLEDQLKGLNAEEVRAKKLWAEHAEHLSHEDRQLLYRLLHEHLHGED